MKQWCPLYVFLYSYAFVIWPDCFVWHPCPDGICPESGPLSLICSITTMLGTLLTIKLSIYVFIGIYSVEVCLEGVFPHSVSTRRDSCVRVYAPPPPPPPSRWLPPSRKKKSNRGTQLSTWTKRGGIWTDACVCLHYWVVIWVAG